MAQGVPNWRDVAAFTDEAVASQIRADEIDILVDLGGHSASGRLLVFARRPAPVQVTARGYASGTGLDAIDYLLADPIAVPAEAHATYSEQVLDLPSILCYAPPEGTPEVAPVPALTNGYVTFGAFNRLAKVSERTLATWGQVMAAVPSARLLIKAGGADMSPAREDLVSRLAAYGVEADRLIIRGTTSQPDHLATHGEVDLMLDTFPQNGGITTLDAILMGVPVVTLLGERVPGRASASFLTTLGLSDLVGRTTDEYVAIAARWASDLERLARERATLRERLLASPVANAETYTRAVEGIYREIWRRWCAERVASCESRVASHEGHEASRVKAGPGRRGVVRGVRAARRVEVAR